MNLALRKFDISRITSDKVVVLLENVIQEKVFLLKIYSIIDMFLLEQ